MEKLVLSFTGGDGYTYCCDENLPFLYESKEKAEYDLLSKWEEWFAARTSYEKNRQLPYVFSEIKFAGLLLDMSYVSFYNEKTSKTEYDEPKVYTLEEWFNINCPLQPNA